MAITIKGSTGIDTPNVNAIASLVYSNTSIDISQIELVGFKPNGTWSIVNSDTTLTAGQNYYANTRAGSLTLTLPASATLGDIIRVQDGEGLASSNNITINRNSHNVDGSARNVILNVDRQGVELIYESSRNGWVSKKEETDTNFLLRYC